MERLIAFMLKWAEATQQRHGVNPWVFLGLLVGCAPFFYYSLYRLGRATLRKEAKALNLWSAVFLGATALPYLYVIVFGRRIPWYIYIVIAALLVQGLWSLVGKLRKSRGN